MRFCQSGVLNHAPAMLFGDFFAKAKTDEKRCVFA